jgi:hypothetical protein
MPKDEWLRANNHAKYGPRGPNPQPTHRRKAYKAARQHAKTGDHWSPRSKLWFGKHKDKEISEVPQDYLIWIVNSQQRGRWWRMDGLVVFLKEYLLAGQSAPPVTAADHLNVPQRERDNPSPPAAKPAYLEQPKGWET